MYREVPNMTNTTSDKLLYVYEKDNTQQGQNRDLNFIPAIKQLGFCLTIDGIEEALNNTMKKNTFPEKNLLGISYSV